MRNNNGSDNSFVIITITLLLPLSLSLSLLVSLVFDMPSASPRSGEPLAGRAHVSADEPGLYIYIMFMYTCTYVYTIVI